MARIKKRSSVNKKKDKRVFSKTASRYNRMNVPIVPMRGGIRM